MPANNDQTYDDWFGHGRPEMRGSWPCRCHKTGRRADPANHYLAHFPSSVFVRLAPCANPAPLPSQPDVIQHAPIARRKGHGVLVDRSPVAIKITFQYLVFAANVKAERPRVAASDVKRYNAMVPTQAISAFNF